MKTSRLVAIAAVGAAIALLMTTDKGKEIREDFMDNADQWKDKLGKLAGKAGDQLSDLKDVISKQVSGLSEDARKRIQTILEESSDTGNKLKDKASKALS